MKRTNHDHRIVGTSIEDAKKLLNSASVTPDRNYMKNDMKPHIEYLDKNGIKDQSDFWQTFHEFGFKVGVMRDFNICCANYINENSENKIPMPRTRQLNKSNNGERNIFLNRMALQYPDKVLKFFESYIDEKLPRVLNRDAFLSEFKSKVQQLVNQIEINNVLIVQNIEPQFCEQQEDQLDVDYEYDSFIFEGMF